MSDGTSIELVDVTHQRQGERWHAEGSRILDENRLTVAEAISPRDAIELAAAPALRDALRALVSAVAGDMQQAPPSAATRDAYLNAVATIADLRSARGRWKVCRVRGSDKDRA